jgi:hypothetical protein
MLSIPLDVLLVVHLHILEYPHADRPEYGQGLFDARVRGLRERTTSMEQIAYFLVGKIEGGQDRARTVRSSSVIENSSIDLCLIGVFNVSVSAAIRHTFVPEFILQIFGQLATCCTPPSCKCRRQV